jgi:2-haloacid dehalogenase
MSAGILFDLLTGLLDSWSLWSAVAGSKEAGLAWRKCYLELTYRAGEYQPYEELLMASAHAAGLPTTVAGKLLGRWDDVQPWPEAHHIVATLLHTQRVGVVTNCSEPLAQRAAARVGVEFDVLVSAERAGFYKPREESYNLALREIGLPAAKVMYVAGSPYDVEAPAGLGMRVVWHDRAHLRGSMPAPPGVTVIDNLSSLLVTAAL